MKAALYARANDRDPNTTTNSASSVPSPGLRVCWLALVSDWLVCDGGPA